MEGKSGSHTNKAAKPASVTSTLPHRQSGPPPNQQSVKASFHITKSNTLGTSPKPPNPHEPNTLASATVVSTATSAHHQSASAQQHPADPVAPPPASVSGDSVVATKGQESRSQSPKSPPTEGGQNPEQNTRRRRSSFIGLGDHLALRMTKVAEPQDLDI